MFSHEGMQKSPASLWVSLSEECMFGRKGSFSECFPDVGVVVKTDFSPLSQESDILSEGDVEGSKKKIHTHVPVSYFSRKYTLNSVFNIHVDLKRPQQACSALSWMKRHFTWVIKAKGTAWLCVSVCVMSRAWLWQALERAMAADPNRAMSERIF